jgi:hypothetical protein
MKFVAKGQQIEVDRSLSPVASGSWQLFRLLIDGARVACRGQSLSDG